MFNSASMQGGLYAAPDPAGFRAFSGRYRTKYGNDPVRTATLAYDAVAPGRGPRADARWSALHAGGAHQSIRFAGIDGLFRFRQDGGNDRGLAVMKVASGGGQPVAGSPKSFGT